MSASSGVGGKGGCPRLTDIVFAIFAQLSFAGEIGDIRTGIGLGDGQTDALVTREDPRQNTIHEFLLTILDQRWAADAKSTEQVPDETPRSCPRKLVGEEQFVEQVPLLRGNTLDGVLDEMCGIFDTEKTCQVATFAALFIDGFGHAFGLVPFGHKGFEFGVNPLSHFGSKRGMGLIVVGRVVLAEIVSATSHLVLFFCIDVLLDTSWDRRKESESHKGQGLRRLREQQGPVPGQPCQILLEGPPLVSSPVEAGWREVWVVRRRPSWSPMNQHATLA